MRTDFSFDVFLSHNRADKARVRRLAERLRDAGLRVWFDDWTVLYGEDIYIAIERGLEVARTLVLCLSPQALASDWVGMERSSILFRDPANTERRFIPLLLADCALPASLRRLKYVDFRTETEESFEELLTACRLDGEDLRGEIRSSPRQVAGPGAAPQLPRIATLERTLLGQESPVKCLAPSPDGRWLASGSANPLVSNYGNVKIWNLDVGVCRVTLPHASPASAVAFTADGKRIVSSGGRGLQVWDPAPATLLFEFISNRGQVHSILSLADGKRVLTVTHDGDLRIWNTTRYENSLYALDTGTIATSVSISHNEDRAAIGFLDGRIRIWDLKSSLLCWTMEGHENAVKSVQFSRDDRFIISGSHDGVIRVWDLEIGTCIKKFDKQAGGAYFVSLSPDGLTLASTAGGAGPARLWDWHEGTCTQTLDDSEYTESLAFSPDGSRLFLAQTARPYRILVFRLASPGN